ncbi:CapA family protein [Planktomarina temperata]|nr:CapA family protein [bacterium]MDB2458916.1 CapA family protein [Planktomarina temperata]
MKFLFSGDAFLAEKINLSESLLETINSNDFLVVNLEGVVTDAEETRADKASAFQVDIENVIHLQKQVDAEVILFLCNNHMLDFGGDGLKDCLTNIRNAGFRLILDVLEICSKGETVSLYGLTADEPSVMSVMSSPNHQFLNYYDDLEVSTGSKHVAICHWGDEYVSVPHHRIFQRGKHLSKSFDVLIGHHPHVIQGKKQFGSTEVFFSLGNFCLNNFTYKNGAVHIFPEECNLGILVQFDTQSKKSEVYGCSYNHRQKTISSSETAVKLFEERSKHLENDIKEMHILWESSFYNYLRFKRSIAVNLRSVWPKYKGLLWIYLKKIFGS